MYIWQGEARQGEDKSATVTLMASQGREETSRNDGVAKNCVTSTYDYSVLPADLLERILSQVDLSSFLNAALVCRNFLKVASTTDVMKRVMARELGVVDVVVNDSDATTSIAGDQEEEEEGQKSGMEPTSAGSNEKHSHSDFVERLNQVSHHLGPIADILRRIHEVLLRAAEIRSARDTNQIDLNGEGQESCSTVSSLHTKAPPFEYLNDSHGFLMARRVSVDGKTSLERLAVQFTTTPWEIKRLNCLGSDLALHCRKNLLVPMTRNASEGELLRRKTLCVARYERDFESSRRLFVVYSLTEYYKVIAKDKLIDEQESQRKYCISNTGSDSGNKGADLARLLAIKSVKEMMKAHGSSVDDATAIYYLDAANGDIREAVCLAKEDDNWERTNKHTVGRRNAR